jgi:outer membrane protein assembly factor BamB
VLFETEVDGVMTKLVGGAQKNGNASVVREEDGDLVWEVNLGPSSRDGQSGVFNNTAWDGKHLLVACNDQPTASAQLFALEGGTGDIAWERPLPGQVMGPITVANGVGFVGAGQELQAFNTETGEVLFRHTVVGTIACAPTIANGRVAVGSGLSWTFGTPGTMLTVFDLP